MGCQKKVNVSVFQQLHLQSVHYLAYQCSVNTYKSTQVAICHPVNIQKNNRPLSATDKTQRIPKHTNRFMTFSSLEMRKVAIKYLQLVGLEPCSVYIKHIYFRPKTNSNSFSPQIRYKPTVYQGLKLNAHDIAFKMTLCKGSMFYKL